MSDYILRVVDLHKNFGEREILHGISFNVKKGETIVFIGPSGTGKSTLLRCINQLTVPDRGHVYIDDDEITGCGHRISEYRQRIGMVFQNFNLFDHLTAVQNVEIAPIKVRKMDKTLARDKAMEELRRVGMEDWADHYPSELSGGQAQRVSIARSLAMDPEVILFDEPTSALDPELTREVLEVMKDLAKSGMTMLVVTHEMGFARSVATEVVFMEGGQIVEQGPPSEIMKNPKHPRTREFIGKISEH
ncbi:MULTISPECIES: amino acid ABC transporter ATP-binding protein [unclassified Methanoregula]|uniref:amino acid ABC transporter ATP-binding protein n=1 Tax=unclassified Methanoregula TaxID=2649730 RepID=UPI0009C5D62F|nr:MULTISPECIES: amino acid ABC transporter ATP-binding protein [unclassified Methanoregula]OPX64281.1 MAG: putative ABC transporter ATP-binding protein [Methanoregula sp. PtaB.Bin085]OPY33594.1 MAG: putative ABC transporter ATP-binding protein [Methanoregula sp. PtaU1.Bin006]